MQRLSIYLICVCCVVGATQARALECEGKTPVRLVVNIVYDQVGSWVLEQNLGQLDNRGAVRQLMRSGSYYHRVVFDYANTSTSVGHAAIFSGRAPIDSGVSSNEVWDAKAHLIRPSVDDPRYAVWDDPAWSTSPRLMSATTVGDVLKDAHPDAKVVSLSIKDRPAVFSAGKHPDAALWYSRHLGYVTSSTYYGPQMPAWLATWNHAHPITKYFDLWKPFDAERWRLLFGSDDAEGEAGLEDLGHVFPYDIRRSRIPKDVFTFVPRSTDYLLDLADEAIQVFSLGQDDTPDLLAISISNTDKVGHAFGPRSWEALDVLVRSDLAAGRFIEKHFAGRTDVAILITADHGVAPPPHGCAALQTRCGWLDASALVERANVAASQVLGEGRWVEAWMSSTLVFSERAKHAKRYQRAVDSVIQALGHEQNVYAAYPIRQLRRAKKTHSQTEYLVRQSLGASLEGDVYVVLQPLYQPGPTGNATGHGSPWLYDREIPLLVRGPGVVHSETREATPYQRIAATMAHFLGIELPATKGFSPLLGDNRTKN